MPTVRSVTYSAEVTLPDMSPEQEIEFYNKINELVKLPEFEFTIQVDNTLTAPSYLIVYSENYTDREAFLAKVEEIYPQRPPYKTIDEIVAEIVAEVSPEDLAYLQSIPKEDMGMFHHTTGMQIRNDYGLWEADNPLTAKWFEDVTSNKNAYLKEGVDYHPQHPDQVSGDILGLVWEAAHNVKV
jgi:hypothetical protein